MKMNDELKEKKEENLTHPNKSFGKVQETLSRKALTEGEVSWSSKTNFAVDLSRRNPRG